MKFSLIPKYKIYIDKKRINDRILYFFIKRIFDVVSSIIFLAILSPFLIYVTIRIKAFDKGKVIYKQKRLTKDGKVFLMYKFRSMHENADKIINEYKKKNLIIGAMFKLKNDPRVTPFGRFMRKHSIDEIPQLFNVIKGDLSLIGPRPPLPSEYEKYDEYDKQRLYVKSGVSGLWQVTYRNDINFKEMVQQDLYYIENTNLWWDLRLVFKTIKVMICPNGLYKNRKYKN